MSSLILEKSLELYILASNYVTRYFLVHKNDQTIDNVIHYLFRVFNVIKQNYLAIEIFLLSLYFSCSKLCYYTLFTTIHVKSEV